MPIYAGYAVDITLLWAIRRRRRTYRLVRINL